MASGLLAARNQLRSQKQRKKSEPVPEVRAHSSESLEKKPEAVMKPAASVKIKGDSAVERILRRHGTTSDIPMHSLSPVEPPKTAPTEYQWQAQQQEALSAATTTSVAAKDIKIAIEHEKTPEMIQSLIKESAEKDTWSHMARELDVGRIVQQLALNSSFQQMNNVVTLSLRLDHKHLNTERAHQQLEAALCQYLQTQIQLEIQISQEGKTPLEWYEYLYQDKLNNAKQSLHDDRNVQFLCQRFAATLDEDSIRPY